MKAWLDETKRFQRSGAMRSIDFRRRQLNMLDRALVEREDAILEALQLDLGKPRAEAYASEIGFVRSEIRYTLASLDHWASPEPVSAPLMLWPARATVRREPFGTVLILGAWNYPVQLLLGPLVPALAAGNHAALKPSELAPHTARVTSALIRETFDPHVVAAFEGGPETAQALTQQPFDMIFFTGSTSTGRKVMQAAAEHLTPVVLELGGCNPCIVDETADLQVTARRIAWGKFLNAGQTCIAPNHVFVERSVSAALTDALKLAIKTFYGADPSQSADYGRIVNAQHLQRLKALLSNGHIVHGGTVRPEDRYFEPTLLTDCAEESPLLRDEIFGPLLPILPYDRLDTVVSACAERPKPLALYVFSKDRKTQQYIMDHVPSGGVCMNDTINHIVGKELPFGGVGASGMGAYHGKAGFDAFTHYRSVLKRNFRPDPGFMYPPMKLPFKWLKRVLRLI